MVEFSGAGMVRNGKVEAEIWGNIGFQTNDRYNVEKCRILRLRELYDNCMKMYDNIRK